MLELLGAGCLLRLDGAAHRDRRHLLNPHFRGASLARRRESIEAVASAELARWPTERPLSALTAGQRIAFTVIAQAFIREVLRWRPPVVDAVRELSEPTTILGRTLPAGTLTMISTVAIHHDATRYPDPSTFRPERFLTDRPVEPGGWIPFGGGRRHCLGAELAVLELSLVLTQLVTTMTVQPVSRRTESGRLQGTMIVPLRGGRVQVSRRG